LVVENHSDPWYRLLAKVKELTGTGAIINTSLNMHGKPMSDAADGVAVSAAVTSAFFFNDPGDMTAGTRKGYTVTRKDAFGNAVPIVIESNVEWALPYWQGRKQTNPDIYWTIN
jgi:microcystin degradation protein MlrC